MDAFVAELAACLEDEDGAETAVVGPAAGRVRRPAVRERAWWPWLALLLGGLGALAALAIGLLSSRGRGPGSPLPSRRAPVAMVRLRAVDAYDPQGDGHENNALLPRASDGNPDTYWATEYYASEHFGNLKNGVGIVFETPRPIRLSHLEVTSDTPGYRAVIEAGSSESGPFRPVSAQMTAGVTTTFSLHVPSPELCYLIWITDLSPGTAPDYQVHINEVSAD
jgi:hypothetical protein